MAALGDSERSALPGHTRPNRRASLERDLWRPYPRRHQLADALFRAKSTFRLKSLTVGFVHVLMPDRTNVVMAVGDDFDSPDPTLLTEATSFRSAGTVSEPSEYVAVPLTSAGDSRWGLWIRGEGIVRERLEPFVGWIAGLTVPIARVWPGIDAGWAEKPREDSEMDIVHWFLRNGLDSEYSDFDTKWHDFLARKYEQLFPVASACLAEPAEIPTRMIDFGDELASCSEWERARRAYSIGYETAAFNKDPVHGVQAAQRVGRALRFLNEWRRATAWYAHALRLAERLERFDLAAIACDGLAQVELMKGSNPSARKWLTRGLAFGRMTEERLPLARLLHAFMLLETDAGNLEEARRLGLESASIYPEEEERLWCLAGLSEVLLQTGDYSEAEAAARRASDTTMEEVAALASAQVCLAVALQGRDPGPFGPMPPVSDHSRAQVAYTRALTYRALGGSTDAARAAKECLEVSENSGAAEFLIRAEALLKELSLGQSPAPADVPPISEDGRRLLTTAIEA